MTTLLALATEIAEASVDDMDDRDDERDIELTDADVSCAVESLDSIDVAETVCDVEWDKLHKVTLAAATGNDDAKDEIVAAIVKAIRARAASELRDLAKTLRDEIADRKFDPDADPRLRGNDLADYRYEVRKSEAA